MTDAFILWWRERSRREQGLLVAMGVLGLIVLGWLLIVRPLGDALDAAKARHNEAAIALAEARSREDAARGGPAAPPSQPVASLIGAAAGRAGFATARVTAEGPGRASVAIDAARPQALFAMLAALERQGVAVERLHAQVNGDRTLAAEATLKARGR
jgi:general secretion pathway protein M